MRVLVDPSAPLLAHVVVTRKCNLNCGYCNEHEKASPPVDTALLLRYVDHLAGLGTTIVTFTGGETLLHPELNKVIARVVSHGMMSTLTTNGLLLTSECVRKLNHAGLELLQISVDSLDPNDSSQKALNRLRANLCTLREARFDVNINAVLGASSPQATKALVREIHSLGFYMTVGLLHHDDGSLDQGILVHENLVELYTEMQRYRRRSFLKRFGEGWEYELLRTGRSDWKCRAGARYLYVDEHGIVSYCSQRRGEPGIPILEYGRTEINRYFKERKGCEEQCTITCVRRASCLDGFRFQEKAARTQSSRLPRPAGIPVGTQTALPQIRKAEPTEEEEIS
jgi:MoaA/NifB/PqqE/SkfB family radical SAM enzyme